MDKKLMFEDIDFADSEYIGCEMSRKDVIVFFNSWDAKQIKITFSNAIQFSCKLGDMVEGVYEVIEGSQFLNEALSLAYEKIPKNHSYKLFQVLDIYMISHLLKWLLSKQK